VFRGLPNPFTATRYHSLVIERETLPDCLEITAWTDDGEIMGVRHKTLAVEGVQFHPESVLTEHGHALLKNFLTETRMNFTPGGAERVIEHREIFHDEMLALMRQIMTGEVSPVMIAALITGLRVKKETIGEITAAAMVMRELSTKVPVPIPTIWSTPAAPAATAHTFNISTAAAFVAAGAGARVAKHGGRSVSSQVGQRRCAGGAGRQHQPDAGQVAAAIDEVGLGFMFAPNFHSAMKHAAPVRKELGVRTLFNILGPLTNPAGAPNQVMGVFHPIWSASRRACCNAWAARGR
jgi:hypothetical protein